MDNNINPTPMFNVPTESVADIRDLNPLDSNVSPEMPELPENRIPQPGAELELNNNTINLETEGTQRMVMGVDGSVSVETNPNIITQELIAKAEVVPPTNPLDNKESEITSEYIQRLQDLISAHTEYEAILKTFGKEDIKEVLLDAKHKGLGKVIENAFINNPDSYSNKDQNVSPMM